MSDERMTPDEVEAAAQASWLLSGEVQKIPNRVALVAQDAVLKAYAFSEYQLPSFRLQCLRELHDRGKLW